MKLITIIIVNWNGNNILESCLKSLKKQTFQNFQLTIVDNASIDNSISIVPQIFPDAYIIPLKTNVGFARGNNIGLQSVCTPYVALLNNDAVAAPEWLASLVDALEKNPVAGIAASQMLMYYHPHIIDRAGDAYCRSGTAKLRGCEQPATEYGCSEYVFGACAGAALYRTAMLRDIGFFDEDFFLLYEDVDLSFRAQLYGYRCLYVPDAIIYHHGSKSIGNDSPIAIYHSHRNLEWVYMINMPAVLIRKSIALHLLYNLAAFFYFSSRGHMITFLSAKFAALKGLNKVLRKRRKVLARKVASDEYLWTLMDKEAFLSRLKRRLKIK